MSGDLFDSGAAPKGYADLELCPVCIAESILHPEDPHRGVMTHLKSHHNPEGRLRCSYCGFGPNESKTTL